MELALSLATTASSSPGQFPPFPYRPTKSFFCKNQRNNHQGWGNGKDNDFCREVSVGKVSRAEEEAVRASSYAIA